MTLPEHLSAADEAAAFWLFRRDCGLGAEELGAFEAWRAASPDHEEAWLRVAASWDRIGTMDEPLIDAMRADALAARPARRWPVRWIAACTAAAAVAAAAVGIIGWDTLRPVSRDAGSVEIAADTPPTYVSHDTMQTFTLADGSQATLDHDSALVVRFSKGARDLRLLKGEALFDVRHDGRPFSVEARDVAVTATGTRFDVQLSHDQVSATLQRGAVKVRRKDDPVTITLAPGQMLVAAKGRPMSVTRVDAKKTLAWSVGFLEFRDTPLDQAVTQIVQGTSVRIRAVGPAARLRVNGRFRSGDPLGFLAAITQVLPVRQRRAADGTIELVRR